jgi:23S rRNA (cytidine1920-2'-O)/16S rRNA (cytidine1409-2'-O)-methyltransferase
MATQKQKVLDRLLEMKLVSDPEDALAQVLSGNVISDKKKFSSLHDIVESDEKIRLKNPKRQYVSRGGDKLASVFDEFKFDLSQCVGIDAGASTGGFTDFCLQRGASAMIAIDVSYGMLAHSLRVDPRVITIERTNIRKLSADQLSEMILKTHHDQSATRLPVDFIVGDLSFISIRYVLPALIEFLKPEGWMLLLIKPQFEAAASQIPPGGVISDPITRQAIIESVKNATAHLPIETVAILPAGVTGRDGNQEYFWGLRKRSN